MLLVDHEKVVIVHFGFDELTAGGFQALIQHHLRLVLGQADSLLVAIAVAGCGIVHLVKKIHAIRVSGYGPLAVIDNFVHEESPWRWILRLAQHTDADLDECAARRRLVITQCGDEFLNRSGDGIMQLGIVNIEPTAKVGVTFKSETRDDPRPVETRRPVISMLGVRQKQACVDELVAYVRMRRIRWLSAALRHEGDRPQKSTNKYKKVR